MNNLYRQRKVANSNDGALSKLPRITNQRDISNMIIANKMLPPIQGTHALGQSPSGRNLANS